jgi:hypothetical protein
MHHGHLLDQTTCHRDKHLMRHTGPMQVAERLSSSRMHTVMDAMDVREARAMQARAARRSASSSCDDVAPRSGCGLAQLFRGKQKGADRVRSRGMSIAPRH